MGRPLLSLCMIAKDEASVIRRCLASVHGIVDEMIVVDTGSTDGTPELCRSLGANVTEHRWEHSFSKARNAGIEQATGQWVLWMDADEELDGEDRAAVRGIVRASAEDVLCLRVMNYMNALSESAGPDEWQVYQLAQARLFRNNGTMHFVRDIHETLEFRQGRPNRDITIIPVSLHHYGYTEERARLKQKYVRNMTLLEKERAEPGHDPWCEYHMAGELYRNRDLTAAFGMINEAIAGFLARKRLPPSIVYKLKYDILFAHGSMRGAWPGIQQAIRLYPDYVDLHFYKGVFFLEHGLELEAVQTFERCLELGDDPGKHLSLQGTGSYRAASCLAECMERMGRRAESAVYRQYAAALKAAAQQPGRGQTGRDDARSGNLLDDDRRVRAGT